jgi:hypothetical protein
MTISLRSSLELPGIPNSPTTGLPPLSSNFSGQIGLGGGCKDDLYRYRDYSCPGLGVSLVNNKKRLARAKDLAAIASSTTNRRPPTASSTSA